MSPEGKRLREIEKWLTSAVAEAFSAATQIAEPAGSSPAWQAICARYQVPQISPAERAELLGTQTPTHGAPTTEFHAVVVAICRAGNWSLEQVSRYDADFEPYDHVFRLIDRTSRELFPAYQRAVLPKPQGGMFANVLAHHDPSAKRPAGPRAVTLTCRHCGAPRLTEDDFTCAYCGGHMAH